MKKYLLLGCGVSRKKKVAPEGELDWNGQLVTVDMSPCVGADVVAELGKHLLPFSDEEFDEIHAYDALEHWGTQGDWRGWFNEFSDYWRVLKPGGAMCLIVPVGEDRYADPGHSRFITLSHFIMLDREKTQERVDAGAPITDYRFYWRHDFQLTFVQYDGNPVHHLAVVLKKR